MWGVVSVQGIIITYYDNDIMYVKNLRDGNWAMVDDVPRKVEFNFD